MTDLTLLPVDLKANRVLVVAPHPDDESLGCGGLLWHLARMEKLVHIVFVTDGGASHLHSATWPRHRLAAEREKEASDALGRLGHEKSDRSFMRLRDADMPVSGTDAFAAALSKATEIVAQVSPDLALLPWRRDPHRDHRDAWALFTEAFKCSGIQPSLLEYAIWLDELGSPDDFPADNEMEKICFAIGEAATAKRHAVEAHLTQTGHRIFDDEAAFRLTRSTIDRLTGPLENYWRPLP